MRGHYEKRTWQYDPSVYAPPKYRKACSYEAFIPEGIADFQVPLSAHTSGVVDDASRAVHELNAYSSSALAPLARLLLRSESIASSRIEGMQVDARDLARAEVRAESGRRPSNTVSEIMANIDAMDLAIATSTGVTRFTATHIADIHSALLRNTRQSTIAGTFRSEQNWIGGNSYNPCGAAYVPPLPSEVGRLIDDLCIAMNADYLPAIVHAAIVHAQFETIHPFADGNGRTGRALIHVVLRRRGLAEKYVPPISISLAANKSDYIKGLEVFREGDLDQWVTLFATAVVRSAHKAHEYVEKVQDLQERWTHQLRNYADIRSDAVAWTLINEVIPGYPVITGPVAAAATGRSKAVVNAGLAQLAEAGILTPLGGGARNRMWEAQGLLDAMATVDDQHL